MAATGNGRKRVAVVGSGITGLSAAWLLHRSGASVTLYESESRCGGHTLTDDSPGYPVDLGFQVYNLTTYPNLVGLLEELGVDTEPSDMSFGLSIDGGALEWGSRGLGAIFAQRRNLLSPGFLRMIWDVIRFGREAPEVLKPGTSEKYAQHSLGQYIREKGYSRAFVTQYLLPMCAAVWSVPNAQVMEFPVVMLVRFWANHHLLDLLQRPLWRVVKDRSRSYVNKILADLPDVRTSAPVTRVEPASGDGRAVVHAAGFVAEEFDAVIFATHTNTTLAALGSAAPEGVRPLLEAIPYGTNDIYLHTDVDLMPRAHATWSSWNFLGSSSHAADPAADTAAVCVTYWLNNLQRLPPGAPDTFVTLNPPRPPAAERTIRHLHLAHPVFSSASYEAQQRLPSVQARLPLSFVSLVLQSGKGGIYYAGAWCGYGFHEDGLKAGMAAATALGATIPWTPHATSPKMSLADMFFMSTFDKFARRAISLGRLRFILPNGEELVYGDDASAARSLPKEDEWMGKPVLCATVRVLRMAFFRKVITRHDTGLGEAYMDGDFLVDDLGALLAAVTANAGNIEGNRGALGILNRIGDWLLLLAHRARANTIEGSRRNIEEHYDAGNAMYKLFLDPSLTYSSGIHRPGDSLEQAQMNKLDALVSMAGITKDDHVLEIGCGWGSMAIRAVQTTGCRWTGLTVSKQQLEEGVARVKAADLSDRITLLFCDYRQAAHLGPFDKVLSCEMIEAVGHENLPAYFDAISGLLKPGGQAVIQAISEPDERYEAYCASSDFIREHIFPGGHLPSMGAMVDSARGTGLHVEECRDIGPHYAVTLRAWRETWERERAAILSLGYSERYWRKFRFYFAYCEAAFDAKYIHNFQIRWAKATDHPAADPLQPSSSQELPKHVVAKAAAPADPVTQVLLAIYFFLAGCVVSQSRMLWVMPAASAVFACILACVSAASTLLFSSYRSLSAEGQAWWCTDVVHLVYSALSFAAAAAYVARHPAALSVGWTPSAAQAGLLPDLLVCTSAGFFGFQLWTLVRNRLFKRSYLAIIHFSLLLVLFGAAASKAQHTPLLSAMLLSELPSVFYITGRLQDLIGVPPGSWKRRAVRKAELATLPLFQLIPHLLIALDVAQSPDAFSAKSYYGIAMAGCLYINAANLRKALLTYFPAQKTKLHAA
ncbi:cyclopropane fatty acid synthase [Coccomyxa subellipsoidea C-169]|uniref:Cyclopropane fatty acid synthase n=1 Tax=Coccomyxa subellipsoidea (strain C-169) TaxID=574566 RepID=I0Z0R4_COCSC|nr:cyclopropane fatty acid synthase [Coccomyxa subellipsoidea C-169]EIE24233.1 cyclopropane fatty acid synthase [Coccomyxa subellipsoidea C-169]|eukprot:XP_005648777.1 cyclopropane fatty acid synthase [Coccomyxa subellipsoidea C-169]